MPDIPTTSDGFVDMDAFDGTDPDAFASLSELGAADVVPALGDDTWGELLNDTFDPDTDVDDIDALVGGDDYPFTHDDDDGDDPFEVEDVDDIWGGDAGDPDADLTDISVDDRSDDLGDDLDAELEVGLDDPELDDTYDDPGANVGELVDFDAGGDLGTNVGELVDFEDDDSIGIEDDLDALENTDFDHG